MSDGTASSPRPTDVRGIQAGLSVRRHEGRIEQARDVLLRDESGGSEDVEDQPDRQGRDHEDVADPADAIQNDGRQHGSAADASQPIVAST